YAGSLWISVPALPLSADSRHYFVIAPKTDSTSSSIEPQSPRSRLRSPNSTSTYSRSWQPSTFDRPSSVIMGVYIINQA
ncbi:hypothetical protein, partial [Chamaesiphon sp. OTE_75_metabat_556]|uniref:hypothetical protein n=1 Tax=Chamaesiphon sp. OTE_75_metabat_556 TaxID=2964692 RepID=UPI00286CDA75